MLLEKELALCLTERIAASRAQTDIEPGNLGQFHGRAPPLDAIDQLAALDTPLCNRRVRVCRPIELSGTLNLPQQPCNRLNGTPRSRWWVLKHASRANQTVRRWRRSTALGGPGYGCRRETFGRTCTTLPRLRMCRASSSVGAKQTSADSIVSRMAV